MEPIFNSLRSLVPGTLILGLSLSVFAFLLLRTPLVFP